jgi:foldase protein PrsA
VKAKRTPLILFGGLTLLLFVGFWVFRGLGQPDVPEGDVAVIEEAVDGLDTITRDELRRGIKSVAFSSGLREPPKPGDETYEQIREAALQELLQISWLISEAEEEGIEVSDRQVRNRLQQIKSQNFPSEQQFQQFLEQSAFSLEDVNLRVKVGLITDAIQSKVNQDAPPVTEEDVADYYEAAKATQYRQPETRDVRLVLNTNQEEVEAAKAELERGRTAADWTRIAKQYSNDPSSRGSGGLRPGITEGLLEKPLDAAIFEAPEGEITGPVKSPLGYYVFEVVKVTPPRTQPLSDVRDQIRTTLSQTNLQRTGVAWRDDFLAKWSARTFCASRYAIADCSNDAGTGHPDIADPACYEENPKGSRPPCPAPVQQTRPAVPGTISAVFPTGTQLPQGPHPPGAAAGVQLPGGLPGGIPIQPGAGGGPGS